MDQRMANEHANGRIQCGPEAPPLTPPTDPPPFLPELEREILSLGEQLEQIEGALSDIQKGLTGETYDAYGAPDPDKVGGSRGSGMLEQVRLAQFRARTVAYAIGDRVNALRASLL